MTTAAARCPVSGQTAEECESGDRTDFHVSWHLDRMVEDGELIKNADGSYSEVKCIHPGVFATERPYEFCPTCQQNVPREQL